MPAEPTTVLLLAVGALLLWPSSAAPNGRRLAGVRAAGRPVARSPGRSRTVPVPVLPQLARRVLVDVAAGLGVAVLLGSAAGLCVGVVAAVGADRLQRRGAGHRHVVVLHDLPLACDLLAVCLRAGLPTAASVAAVGSVVAEPLQTTLTEVAGRYRLGAAPAAAWADAPVELAGVARALVRAGGSGSAVAGSLEGLSADERAAERSRVEARVRQAGVWLLAPLGACFLPAFLCLGVVPLVLGIAAGVFA